MTLAEDLEGVEGVPDEGFDAVVCLGSSIAHVPEPKADQTNTRQALKNIMSFVRPGGILLLDHRNFDYIVATKTLPESINYPVSCSVSPLHGDDGIHSHPTGDFNSNPVVFRQSSLYPYQHISRGFSKVPVIAIPVHIEL